jgi:drug/metabolite transporter (DMT)-like permease
MFNAFVWGVSWWPFRQLQAAGLHPLWATALIYALALACLLAGAPGRLARLCAPAAVAAGWPASGLTNVGFNWAVTVGDVVRVVLLFYLMPAWSVLLAWPLLGERPRRMALLRLVLAFGGCGGGAQARWHAAGPCPRACPTGWRWRAAFALR